MTIEAIIPLDPTAVGTDDAGVGAGRFRTTLRDWGAMTRRNVLHTWRTPRLIIFSTATPLLFVVLFRFMFAGAIRIPGVRYVDFLIPGVMAETIGFCATGSGLGLAEDISGGFIERLRTLPMARSAVLAGRVASDVVRFAMVAALTVLIGLAVGFRPEGGILALAGSVTIMCVFGFSVSWVFASLGLALRDVETTTAATFPTMAILVFMSSAFVPASTLPSPVRGIAAHQPLSAAVNATRRLILSDDAAAHLGLTHSTGWYIGLVGLWMVILVGVFGPIAVALSRWN